MSLNIPDFILFYFSLFLLQILVLVYFNPPPLPLKKGTPLFPSNQPPKTRSCQAHPLFENFVGGCTL